MLTFTKLWKAVNFMETGIGALYTVVMQDIACQSLFGKDSGLYQNLRKNSKQLPQDSLLLTIGCNTNATSKQSKF